MLHQNQPLPQAPGAVDDDLYDDPTMAAMDYETSVVGSLSSRERDQFLNEDESYALEESNDIYGEHMVTA